MQRIISLLLLLPSLAFAQTQIPDGVISESSVTQHEAALTITESQISDLTHVTDTNTQLSDAQVATAAANEGFVTGAHTTNTNLDQSGVEALGFVTGSHTVDTDTNLDLAGVQALGFVAGAHTTDTNTSVLTECAGSQVLEADGDCIATSGLGGGGGSEGTTVSDTAEIDLTLTTVDITANIVAGSIDETKLDASVNASLDLADSAIQTEAQTLTSGTGFLSISGGNTVFLSSSDSYVNSVSVLRSTSELDFALSNSGVAADVALEIPLSSASQV